MGELTGTRSPSALEDAAPHLPAIPTHTHDGIPLHGVPPCLAPRANPSQTHSEPGLTYHLGEGASFPPSQPGEKKK